MSPAVSIVILCFNGERWLPESIESVLSQGEVDFEIIVVNNGSDDDSSGLVKHYAKADPRVRLIVQPRSGVSRARNKVRRARADGSYSTWTSTMSLNRLR